MSEELKHKIYSSTECISEQTMFDYIDKKLSAKERHTVEKHMLGCDICSDAMEGLELVKDRNKISVINKNVNELISTIAEKETKIISINYKAVFSIAAGIALLVGGIFFFKTFTSSEMKNSDVAEVLPPSDSAPPPPPAKETEISPLSPSNEVATGNSEKGPETKSPGINKDAQLETSEDLKQNIALSEGKEKGKNEDFKTTVTTNGATNTAQNTSGTYSWSATDNQAKDAKSDDVIAKQEDARVANVQTESTVNVPMGGAGEVNKNVSVDETKKAEEKVVMHNNTNATPVYSYENQTAKPDQNQEQKNDKSNSNGDQLELAKKSSKEGNNRSESKGKDKEKDKITAAYKTDEDWAKEIPAEPAIVVSDKEQVQTVAKTAPATSATTADNTTVDGLLYRETQDSTYAIVDQMPEYPGGSSEMMKFIQKNFKYSKLSGMEGTKIIVQFTVDKEGGIKNPKIIKGINIDLNKEAMRVVSLMPKFIPGKNKGRVVPSLYNLPIQLEIR